MSRVSRYSTGITVAIFDHKKECKLTIIDRIISCELVIYVFVGSMKIKIPVFFITLKRRGVYHISDIILKLGYYILFHPRLYY